MWYDTPGWIYIWPLLSIIHEFTNILLLLSMHNIFFQAGILIVMIRYFIVRNKDNKIVKESDLIQNISRMNMRHLTFNDDKTNFRPLRSNEYLHIKTTWIKWKPIHQSHLNIMKTSTSKRLESYENLYIKTTWILWVPLH